MEVAGCQCLDHVDHRLKIQTEGSAVRVALTLPASTKALTTDSLQWGVRFSMSTLTYKVIFGKLVNQAAGIWHLASKTVTCSHAGWEGTFPVICWRRHS